MIKVLSVFITLSVFASYGNAENSFRGEIKISDEWEMCPAKTPTQLPPENTVWGKIYYAPWWPGSSKFPKGAAFNRKTDHSLWVSKRVMIPNEWKGKNILLDFPHLRGDGILFVNRQRCGSIYEPAGELDISKQVKFGTENEILFFSTRNGTGMEQKSSDFPFIKAYRAARGIDKKIENWAWGILSAPVLKALPEEHVSDVFAKTSWRRKELAFEVECTLAAPGKRILDISVSDETGKIVREIRKEFSAIKGVQSVELKKTWNDPIPWELNRGYLYTASVQLLHADGTHLDSYPPFKFGFREVWREGRHAFLNGHPLHLRITYNFEGIGKGFSFFRLMGYNSTIQPHCVDQLANIKEDSLDYYDATGTGFIAPLPSTNYIRSLLLTDQKVAKEYERLCKIQTRRYRNHPCILVWYPSVNSFCPKDNINPLELAKNTNNKGIQADIIRKSIEIARPYTLGSLCFSHADGSTSDVSSSNIYLNFTPLQEREDWLMEWNANGEYPYMAAELGQPYTGCYYKGNNFLLTEYMAMYFGDRAYSEEGTEGLQSTLEHSLNREPHEGALRPADLKKRGVDLEKNFPIYWDFRKLFTWNTNRAWRTWGINMGMLYFNLQVAYGNPPGANHIWYRYKGLKDVMTSKPDWANAAFDIHKLGNQDFLGYIAGTPRHTDKTHTYYSGENIAKNAGMIWDGPGTETFSWKWNVFTVNGKQKLASGRGSNKLRTGDIVLEPFAFSAPKVSQKTDCLLSLSFLQNGKEIFTDEFPFSIYPKITFRNLPAFGLFDPDGKTAALFSANGIPFVPVKNKTDLKGVKQLVIGKNALDKNDFPYDVDAVRNGLNILILEQTPETWKSFGLLPVDTLSRTIFLHKEGRKLFPDLIDRELAYWRGEPGLKTEQGPLMRHDAQRGPRWTHTHAVAPLVLQIPERAGFRPLLACEFDMNYSPLLRFGFGNGSVTFCTLAFENRLGKDPAADKVFQAMIADLARPAQKMNRTLWVAGKIPEKLWKDLILKPSGGIPGMRPQESVLVVGSDAGIPFESLRNLAEDGASVLIWNQKTLLREAGLKTEKRECFRLSPATEGSASGAGLNLLRFRDRFTADFILPETGWKNTLDGLLAERNFGKGQIVFFQMDPYQFENRYAEDPSRLEATALTSDHMLQLTAGILNHLEVAPSTISAERLNYKQGVETFFKVNFFYVLGPFKVEQNDSKLMLNTVFSGEASAIAGDNNPNIVYQLPDGRKADWRRTVTADSSGFINLAKEFPKEFLSVSYAVCYINSKTDRTAMIKFGCDWRAKIWCNGKLVFYTETGSGHYGFDTKIQLKKGENHITVKLGSGSAGNGFRMMLEEEAEADSKQKDSPRLNAVSFYRKSIRGFDPYVYIYW